MFAYVCVNCHFRMNEQAFSIMYFKKCLVVYTLEIFKFFWVPEKQISSDKKMRFCVLNYSKWSEALIYWKSNCMKLAEPRCAFRVWSSSSLHVTILGVVEPIMDFSSKVWLLPLWTSVFLEGDLGCVFGTHLLMGIVFAKSCRVSYQFLNLCGFFSS